MLFNSFLGDKQSEDKQSEDKPRVLDSALAVPVGTLTDAHLLATMQGMLCHLLMGRASRVLVGLGRYLQAMAADNVVTFNQLEQALRTFHIGLTIEVRAILLYPLTIICIPLLP